MNWPNKYSSVRRDTFSEGDYSIVPIRYEDRMDIMKWRNEQIYHLRQQKPLKASDQDIYFGAVVYELFSQENPHQYLFSYLKEETCIGYGGLVHINWTDMNAEISFIMDTNMESEFFAFHWQRFLELIEVFGFQELKMHKLFVYAFDLRPQLYEVLRKNSYFQDARLTEHCRFGDTYIDVIIHSKINHP